MGNQAAVTLAQVPAASVLARNRLTVLSDDAASRNHRLGGATTRLVRSRASGGSLTITFEDDDVGQRFGEPGAARFTCDNASRGVWTKA